jgi:SEC-C motif-containing protein
MIEMCPCGSGKADCCAPLIAGTRRAHTAEALMRSRYTAFVRGAIDYLIATHDPATRATLDVPAMTSWSRDTTWLGLEIVSTAKGGATDPDGIVEFIAFGVTNGKPFRQRERSRFRRLDGAWVYVDGVAGR